MKKRICIKDLGEIITGKTPPTSQKDMYGDEALFVKPTDMSENSKYTFATEEGFSQRGIEKYSSILIPKGATLVPCIGTVGRKMTMSHTNCYTNQSVNSIIPNQHYDEHYVYYLIKNFLPNLKLYNLGTASGREYISKTNFENIELDVFEKKSEQKRIANVLSRYDDLIENYRRQIKLLEEAAQRLYKEWFIDMRFPGHETAIFGDDGLPLGWRRINIDEVYSIKYGKNLSTNLITLSGKYPVYGANGVIGYYDKANCTVQSVLITSRGNGSGDITMTKHSTCFVTNNSFIVLPQMQYDYIGLYFTYFLLQYANLKLVRTGAAQPQLTNASIHLINVIIPNKELIHKFNSKTVHFSTVIVSLERQIAFLSEARDRLLPRLMSGEIEV